MFLYFLYNDKILTQLILCDKIHIKLRVATTAEYVTGKNRGYQYG